MFCAEHGDKGRKQFIDKGPDSMHKNKRNGVKFINPTLTKKPISKNIKIPKIVKTAKQLKMESKNLTKKRVNPKIAPTVDLIKKKVNPKIAPTVASKKLAAVAQTGHKNPIVKKPE